MHELSTAERVLFVFADARAVIPEVGGSLLRLVDHGGEATVVYGTGEQGRNEALEGALAEIGIDSVWFLEGLPEEELPAIVSAVGAAALVIGGFAPGDAPGQAVRESAVLAAAHARIPAYIVSHSGDAATDAPTTQIDIRAVRTAKWEAMRASAALLGSAPVPAEASGLPAAEGFVTLRPAAAPLAPEVAPRAGVGSRILSCVLALGVGAAFGALGTVMHSEVWRIGGAELPWGLALSLIAIAALLTSLRLILGGRLVSAICAVGVLGTVFLFSLRSPGGSVLIPATLLGQIWTIAPALIAALVLAWPELSAGTRQRAAVAAAVRHSPEA